MNTAWMLGLALALVLIVGVVVLLVRRGRHVPPPPAVEAPRSRQRAPSAPSVPSAPPAAKAAEIDARRHVTTEALRQARQRKADEAARLEVERAAQAQARTAAAARSAAAQPPAAAAPRTQAGWASRPMDLGPAEPPARRPHPTPVAKPPATPLSVVAQPVRLAAPVEPLPAPSMPPSTPPSAMPLHPAATARVPVVLVADDSKVVRVKTGRLLEKQGWQVLLADDGAAALRLLDSHVPDLLITDVEMPGVDGFALTREVRGHARCARLPVIMITSSDERHRAEAQAAGVDLLLGKPYAEEMLLTQAQRLLGVVAPVLH
jgi:CheY-like chemotaxis protein